MKFEDIFDDEQPEQFKGFEVLNVLKRMSQYKEVYFAKLDEPYHDYFKYPVNHFHSWRGDYNQPSISSEGDEVYICVELISELESFFGSSQTGWKGGKFIMDEDDFLWCDNRGSCDMKGIREIKECKEGIFLVVDQYQY